MGEFPTFVNVRKVERRAAQIADPIHRLRYLRHATAAAPLSSPKRGGRLAASLLLVLLAIPLQILSDANVRRTPDLSLPMPPAIRYGSQIPNVWIVDKTKEFEVYSNGLRIENQLAISGQPRWYMLLGRDPGARPGPRRSEPAGIVFHTTESDQAPFEADQNHALIRIGRELLLYVRNKRAYHFLIDRFGRVHRIVMESDAASHAGHSVWADDQWLYMNLNNSFLGVALEGSSQPDKSAVNEAQVHALKVLTEMLRSKYSLPSGELCHPCAGLGKSLQHANRLAHGLGNRLPVQGYRPSGQLREEQPRIVSIRLFVRRHLRARYESYNLERPRPRRRRDARSGRGEGDRGCAI